MIGAIITILCIVVVTVILIIYVKKNHKNYFFIYSQNKPNTRSGADANYSKPYLGKALNMNVPPKAETFDYKYEKLCLKELEEYKNDPETVHFLYIKLQELYYKYRDIDPKYLDLCIEYCHKDIEMLTQVDEQHINEQIQYYVDHGNLYTDEQILKEIEEIKEKGFDANIPAFKRMAIIEEKRNNIPAAMLYCDLAIRWYEAHSASEYVTEFRDRKKKLVAKIEKNNRL